jgi:hypothetical protein
MGKVTSYISISLDGFTTAPNDKVKLPLGSNIESMIYAETE